MKVNRFKMIKEIKDQRGIKTKAQIRSFEKSQVDLKENQSKMLEMKEKKSLK